MNYFELFDLPVSLCIDPDILTKKYIALQKKYHPDFYTLATDAEKDEALEKSAQLNKAIKVLKNEMETIKYVLQLKGVLEEEEKYKLDPDFLMEMMDLNETALENQEEATKKIHATTEDLYASAKSLIQDYNDEKITLEQLNHLKEYYYKKKYLHRILDKISK